MTLGELIDWHRPKLEDESVGVRRSWEEMFTYTLKHYSRSTPLETFALQILSQRLAASGMHQQIVDGYVKRWHAVLASLYDNEA
ncbi:hypothetical protein [Agrobacterium tumefaciens]|uniref:Uncharacterized protein n=2 Tax=Agrobacterium tumefaciens TaxID=358 RepID=A0AA44F9V0_AGRTU|nr:hypothetical protein [Agrobacterium tumefaciens]NTB87983.1 hypothetical protein [Agrobacterium tumefaciens]NTC31230.1 hypothetical protein [Agrobacterium tumefaciens]NTF00387.1 hypothetical protein [Agrobacterium tumefaciens]